VSISPDTWERVWSRLCRRFRVQPDGELSAEYHGYLDPRLDEQAFVAAAEALWATREFFPRPADFVTIAASAEWPAVVAGIAAWRAGDGSWKQAHAAIPTRAWAAVLRLGDIETAAAAFERDPMRYKAAWEQAYEQATAAESLSVLPRGEEPQARISDGKMARIGVGLPTCPACDRILIHNEDSGGYVHPGDGRCLGAHQLARTP